MNQPSERERPHVVIVGGGFGGLFAAKALAKIKVRVTLIDRTNHHVFQPLLYQVAIAGLSPADIASPIRSILRGAEHVTVLLDEVVDIVPNERRVKLHSSELTYDYLILATGVQTSYFGHDDWEHHAVGLKTLDDALEIRRRVLVAFEAAERESDAARRTELLTFVAIGGGPTGVELAGSIAELARTVLAQDFHRANLRETRVILIEAGPRILSSFSEDLSRSAVEQLSDLGVEVRTDTKVTGIDHGGVHLGDEYLHAATVLWCAGVRATPLTAKLGVPTDRSGRVIVGKDLSITGRPEVFVIGDIAVFTHQTGQPLPGVCQVAMQQGVFAARAIDDTLRELPRGTFRYRDKGNMATIGRSAAIAQIGGAALTGVVAWFAWLLVHLIFLIGFRNRLSVLLNWTWAYLKFERGARLITGHRLEAGTPETPEEIAAHTPPQTSARTR